MDGQFRFETVLARQSEQLRQAEQERLARASKVSRHAPGSIRSAFRLALRRPLEA
jgi:hypothetical protein